MRPLATYALLLLLIACNTSEEKKASSSQATDKQKTAEQKKKSTPNKTEDIFLPQKGDYTALFEKQECDKLITLEELSSLKGVPAQKESYGCFFKFDDEEDSPTRIGVSHQKFSKKSVQKEIRSYIKNAPFIYHEISETGDNYICFQPATGRVLIYNPNYENTILISYSKRTGAESLDKQQIEANKKFASNLANFLIKKFKS